jgi:hypothetical protein
MEKNVLKSSVSDPHQFYADPDPAFLLNADPDRFRAVLWIRIRKDPKLFAGSGYGSVT